VRVDGVGCAAVSARREREGRESAHHFRVVVVVIVVDGGRASIRELVDAPTALN
jgi:hypothetical protein